MNIIEFADKDQLGKAAAAFIARTIESKTDAVLGLATGGTPIDTYKELIQLHETEQLSFKQARTVNLDEYVGIDPNHENSYMTYMKRHLFDHIDLPSDQYFLPNGAASHLEEECLRYDQLIEDLGVLIFSYLVSDKMDISGLMNLVLLLTQRRMSSN